MFQQKKFGGFLLGSLIVHPYLNGIENNSFALFNSPLPRPRHVDPPPALTLLSTPPPPPPWSYTSHTSLSTSINWLACLCCATLSTGSPSSSSPSPGATPCENLFMGISKTVTENRQCAFPCTNQCTGVDPREKIPEKKNSTKLSWKPSSSCPKWCQVLQIPSM